MNKLSRVVSVAALAGAAFAGNEAILLERPQVWYAFDNTNSVVASGGSANLSFTNSGATFVKADEDDWAITSVSGQCPYGTGFPCGTGSWTIHLRAKTVSEAGRIVLGTQSITAGNRGLVMYTAGGDKVRFSVIENFVNFEATLEISVTDAATAYHDYAIALDVATARVHVSVDGVERGSLAHSHYNRANTSFQFFSMNGGVGESGLVVGEGCAITDYRVYQRRLTSAEISALHAGRTPVSVYGGFLNSFDMTVWKNTLLKDIVRVRARTGGSSIGKEWAVPFYATHSATDIDVQMQYIQDGRYNKVMWAHFTQDGDNVKAKMNKVGYLEPSSYTYYGVNGTVGNDFSINWVNNGTTAIGNQTSGYGLYQLTADTLYDDGAAVWNAASGSFSTVANWKDGVVAAAGRNVSFVTGSGTVQNDLAAGTAFGRLAFGIESGSWTIYGNAASFAEVVNASTNAQTILAPLSYDGDFEPETWGTLTFKDLTVGGTFKPVGTGEIVLTGDTQIATADLRYNVRTEDNPVGYPPCGSGWTASKGYATNGKKQIHSLRTLPGGHTTIGYLQANLAGQRRLATVMDGDFTIVDPLVLGNDCIFAVKNGTTTLENAYRPTSTLGVNSIILVHEGGTISMPAAGSGTGLIFHNEGTVNCTSMENSGTTHFRRTGTFNSTRISGTLNIDGATVGPLNGQLVISAATTLTCGSEQATATGAVFRTSAPDGTPGMILQNGALTLNAAVPVSFTGGGTFRYAPATAAAFNSIAPITVAENTTLDVSACTAATFTNTVSLAAGAKIVLPEWNGDALFELAPALPSEGQATIVLSPSAAIEAGEYTLVASGVPADAADHLAVTLAGANASRYGATLSVVNGALKATVTRAAATGEMISRITFTGYTGSDTLVDFPALVKLPAMVDGFAYSDAAADGADIYFTDAAGNRIPHEIDTWNASGDSLVWVRVPALADSATYVTLHWGGGTANVPALSGQDVATFNGDYMGVWHFSDFTSSATPDSTTNALTMTARGTVANLTLQSSPVGTGMYNPGDGAGLYTPNDSKWLQYATTHQLTISGWFKTTRKTANQRIVSSKTNWQSLGGFEVTTRGTAATELLAGGANNKQYTKTGIANYNSNWIHFTVIFDGTQATPVSRMYVNGALVQTSTDANYDLKASTDPLTFFSYGATLSGSNELYGYIDEMRLSKSVRSDDWIKAAYTTMNAPGTFATAGAATEAEVTTPYDFRALTTANTVAEDTGAYAVFAGVDTTLTYPGYGLLTIEEGKKATVPGWNGAVENLGYIKYTTDSIVDSAPLSGTIEYAATHALAFAECARPLVFSGNVFVSGEYALFQYAGAPVTVTGGTTTLSGLMRIGERNADVGFGTNYGGILNVTGGLVQADELGTLDSSGYADRAQINISGGRFTVPLRAWCGSVPTNVTVNVSGTGVFAPDYFGLRNSGTISYTAVPICVSGTGSFVAPSQVPSWTLLTAGAGTPVVTAAAGATVDYAGAVSVPAGTTLTFSGAASAKPYFAMSDVISGAGTIAVENAILDLSGDVDFTAFEGAFTVRAGGVLILPADEEAPFPINLEEGARIIATVTETPGDTGAFLGALASVPASGTATIEFVLPQSMPQGSTYTISTSALPAGAADHLAVEFTGEAGGTTAGAISLDGDGKVQVTITESENKGGALEWAGATDETVTADDTVLAWKVKDSGDATKIPFYPNLPLWFTDSATLRDVTVADAVKTGPVTFSSSADYTLFGSAQIDAPSVTKEGTGTVEINGAGFAAPERVTVKGGVLRVGNAAHIGTFGTKDTTVVVEDGATIDLNMRLAANDTDRGAILQNQTVVISGEGKDGRGAITDESEMYQNYWHYQLGRVVVASNATISGTSRIDLRKPSTATYEGNTSLTGANDVTLTIKTHVDESINMGVDLNNTDVAIGKIVLAEGGMLGAEGATTFNVPNGIEMKTGSRFHYWGATGQKAAITVTGTGTGLKSSGADTNVQDAPVTVREGASTDMRGDKVIAYSSAFTNEGAVTVSAATHKMTGTMAGSGSYAVSGGDFQVNPSAASGELNLAVSGGTAHVGAVADWSSVPMTIAQTGGTLWWGMGQAEGLPTPASVNASGITGGTIQFHSGAASATVAAGLASAKPANVKFFNNGTDQKTIIPAGNWTVTSRISVGNNNYPSHLVLANGANVSANNLAVAVDGSAPKDTYVEIGPGSTLTLSDYARIGEYSGASEYWHEVIVNGGTFSCANVFAVAYDSPLCYATLSSGRMSVGGLNVRSRTTYIYGNSDERFTMTGGELDLGASGITTSRAKYYNTHANLQGGLYKATANHSVGYYGMLVATGEDMDDPGELTIDLNGKTVTHKNTPHFGSSAVTLTGGGSYVTSSDLQGIVNGKWTVDTAANATVNLTGFAGFAGGLELKDGTSASLGISGESAVEYHCLRGGNFATGYAYASTNGQFNSVVSHLKRFTVYTTGNSGPANSCAFLARGQFYVPEDDAGTWTFAGAYDDNIGLWVDGTLVISNTYQNVVCKQAEMTAGWHDFILVTRDGTGGQGPTPSGWQNNMCLGWKKGVSTSKTAADYNIFDTSTLRMRVKKPITSDGVTVERVAGNYSNIDTLRARRDWAPLWETNTLQNVLNTKIAQQQTSSMRCTGGFLVDEAHEGEWTFYGSWDDRIILTIDGVEVLANTAYNKLATSTAKLTAGWHAFEIRFGDGTGGYGPDAANINSGYGLAVMRPGDSAKQPFDERTLTITTKALVAQIAEKPGLGGTVTVGAGATLSNGSPWSGANLTGRFCPIYGTLTGSGTLSGSFRFTGATNCWEIASSPKDREPSGMVKFTNADAETLAGLKSMKVVFSGKPTRKSYDISDALGLTAETVANVALIVTDEEGTDYGDRLQLAVQGDKLRLLNSKPAGITIIIR